jgi:hypothetical protein
MSETREIGRDRGCLAAFVVDRAAQTQVSAPKNKYKPSR